MRGGGAVSIPRDVLAMDKGMDEWCILHGYRGSIAHGMFEPSTEPNSIDDKDTMGVCVPPLDYYYGLREYGSRGTREIKYGEWDIVIYEARKVFRLLTQGNPNVLSLLWLPDNLYIKTTRAGQILRDCREVFVGRHVYRPFIGYAMGQLKRLDSSDGRPLRELAYIAGIFDGEGHVSIDRTEGAKSTHAPVHYLQVGVTNTDRDLIEWLLCTYGGHVGRTGLRDGHRRDAYRWRLTGPPGAKFLRELQPFLRIKRRQAEIAIEFAHEMATRQRGKSLTEYEVDRREELRQTLKASRTDKFTPTPEPDREWREGPERYSLAYMGEKRKALVAKHGYDTKNAAHLIRLLRMGIEFLRDGGLNVDRGGYDAAELLAIKHGEWSLERIKSEAERLFRRAEEVYDRSTLPPGPDRQRIPWLCVDVVRTALETT
jgi:hypothetical protein